VDIDKVRGPEREEPEAELEEDLEIHDFVGNGYERSEVDIVPRS
jgi:hypothetical protein